MELNVFIDKMVILFFVFFVVIVLVLGGLVIWLVYWYG